MFMIPLNDVNVALHIKWKQDGPSLESGTYLNVSLRYLGPWFKNCVFLLFPMLCIPSYFIIILWVDFLSNVIILNFYLKDSYYTACRMF